jgi:outer membrane protein assembly factor BamB
MEQNTLNILWKKNIEADFEGKNITWGVNESPLIVDEKVILSVGGKTHNIVALNKNDGSLIWSCEGEGDLTAYCSPLYIANQDVPLIATMMASHIVGVDVATGKKLWSYKYENNRKIHPNTPVYDGKDMLLFTGGYNKGAVMFRLTNGGRSIEEVWEQPKLQSKHGGMVKIGNHVYTGGDGNANKFWYCVDWNTGEINYQDNTITAGVVIADGDNMLYCYSERGEMALVKAPPEKFDLISKFSITLGTAQHWAHPVIYQGVLYVRHGNTLMSYKIK